MSAFGRFRVQLAPWEIEYGAELAVDTDDADFEETVFDVEPGAAWNPIMPQAGAPPEMVFVDGVRRVEARVVVRDGERIVNGALGAFAVGSVHVDASGARWGRPFVDRVVACGAGVLLPDAIETKPSAKYRPISTDRTGPNDPMLAIQDAMRRKEAAVAQDFASSGLLVIADGPLSLDDTAKDGRAVGYIKSLHRIYLPSERLDLLTKLPVAGRTPLFLARTSQKKSRWSWFLRLATPGRGESELSGLVRLEVAEGVGVDEACSLANLTTANLPRFASRPSRDPRAPQNLVPVGALEAHLRRALGDRRLARRHIRSFIAGEANHV